MKVIKKTESVSVIHEIIFHRCLNNKEVKNAFEGISPENIFMYQRIVDTTTFVPSYWVIVTKEPTQSLAQGLKYEVSMPQLIDANIPLDKFREGKF